MKFVVVTLLALSSFANVSLHAQTANAQTAFGRRAPGFALMDTKDKWQDIQDYRGKVVLVDFMRTDCPKCKAVTGVLEDVKAKYGDKVQILTVIPLNGVDTPQSVSRYILENKATGPFMFDCGQMTASYLRITPQNRQVHFPHLVVVDKGGMIRREMTETTVGGVTLQTISSTIDPLLK